MKKVFLIDDEANVRESMRDLLAWTSFGCVVCGDAADGELALPLIEKEQPDIVVSDIQMPFMDGLELSRTLRVRMPFVKIILLSGHEEFRYAREAMRIGVSEYCLKPISSAELETVVRHVAEEIDEQRTSSQLAKREGLSMERLIEADRTELVRFMKLGMPEDASAFSASYMARLDGIDWRASWTGSFVCTELVLAAYRYCKDSGMPEAMDERELLRLERSLEAVQSAEEAAVFMEGVLERVTHFRERGSNKYAAKMNKAKEFIREKASCYELSQLLVAEHVGMSPSYFSTIFSQETGRTFVEFLTSVRLQQSIHLLQTTDLKTYEIAYKVGYNDAHYFSYLFKKFTGQTTREYRKTFKADFTAH